MKKIFLLLLITFSSSSCVEEVVFNNPSVQGKVDNVFWRSASSKAVIATNGSMMLTAEVQKQELIIKTSSNTLGTYLLGDGVANTATFIVKNNDNTSIVYITGEDIGGEGQIVITEFDNVNKTISGTFRFNAVNHLDNPLGGEILNFQQGVFYKVPVTQ